MQPTPSYRRYGRRRRARRPLTILAAILAALVVAGAGFVLAGRASGPAPGVAAVSPSPGASSSPSPSASAAADPSTTPSPSDTPASTAAPSPLPTRIAGGQPVPILVYHHVTPELGGDRLLYVSPSQFDTQLAYLKSHGYEAVTMRQVYDAWTGVGTLPDRPIVLTFDDGYVNQVKNAGAILRRYGWPGELALFFNILYKGSQAPAASLTPELVRRLVDDGWGIESHSVSHPDLRTTTARELRHEMEYSRKRLEQIFDVPIDFFCYPGGNYDRRVARAAHEAGYLAATTIESGAATPADLYALPRIFVWWGEPVGAFGKRIREAVAAAGR